MVVFKFSGVGVGIEFSDISDNGGEKLSLAAENEAKVARTKASSIDDLSIIVFKA